MMYRTIIDTNFQKCLNNTNTHSPHPPHIYDVYENILNETNLELPQLLY